MPRVRPTAAVLLACLSAAASPSVAADGNAGWAQLGRLDPVGARDAFGTALAAHPGDRELRLGAALAELNLEPRTDQHVASARAALQQLQAEAPDDDAGIAAAYHLARIRQLYDEPADPTAAIAAYRRLLAAHPGNATAERAAPKLAVLLLYADVGPTAWEARVAEIEALLPRLASRPAQRDTRLVLAGALLRLRQDPARAYPLISYCLDHDLIVRPPAIAQALLEAGEAARGLGRNADAARYYGRYVREFPYEGATDEIRRRLAALAPEAAP